MASVAQPQVRRLTTESTTSDVSIAIIGAGKMAEAITNGMKTQNQLPQEGKLHVYDLHKDRCELFRNAFGAVVHTNAIECVRDADVVMMAVKPQNLPRLALALREAKALSKDSVVLSIMAGVTQEALAESLQVTRVARSMPNTPAAVQQGITMWTCTHDVTNAQRHVCGEMLRAFGEEVFVEEEKYLDMATAVSGSGPSYVFLLMEAMIDTGVHFGFPRAVAEKLVYQTVRGAAEYAIQSDSSVSSLRADIVSPGGTTASALYTLEKGNLRTTIADGLWAAYRRSLELGKQDPNVGPDRNKKYSP